ncbi:conserved hypothetical protein [Treponema primitia ZAS-2]|uniref:Lipoprotein n=1 Tax=Treponema primitia (strain ATCC BAA-887 / DSM 12427 / ZAS-2) TaxID=545694 RepID=F5YII4_TREPZ|nr:hypothetical protein [Treponema primitia]AEF84485.1 conserved hypothetical protein [Treponema primitia ZAS-2]
MKQRKTIFLALVFFAGVFSASVYADIGLNIRYFDKRIYYAQDDPIFVQVTITNSGPYTYRFKLADDRAFSIDFDIRTMSNLTVNPAEILVRRRSTSQQVFFREIAVESGESFSFVEDLRNYAELSRSGAYVVQARMYPELLRDNGSAVSLDTNRAMESNRLSLNLRPPALPGPEGILQALDVETNANLVREKLSPDQVVNYILSARQKTQWEKFFLYLDLEAMIIRDSVRQRQWLAESEEGRRRMLARYRKDLEAEITDGDIATIPMEFQIERTQYSTEEGTVSVLEKFKTGNYIERKRYTYYLRRRDDVWTIVDYTVLNLGTE